jgi:hypothetical protein
MGDEGVGDQRMGCYGQGLWDGWRRRARGARAKCGKRAQIEACVGERTENLKHVTVRVGAWSTGR